MEVEQNTPIVAKKLFHIVRIVFFMLKKGICKNKLILDLNLLLKKGMLAGKAVLDNLLLNYHYTSFKCRSKDAVSFISPREYEFSCSNSPAYPAYQFHRAIKRKHRRFLESYQYQYDDMATVNAVQKVLEMLNNDTVEASTLVSLPGFGKSPVGKQLRISDSPFPLKDEGDSQLVDKAAEEFISRFYKDLKRQKNMALDSPYHGVWGR